MRKVWIASPKCLIFAAYVVRQNKRRGIRAKTNLQIDIVHMPLHAHPAELKGSNQGQRYVPSKTKDGIERLLPNLGGGRIHSVIGHHLSAAIQA